MHSLIGSLRDMTRWMERIDMDQEKDNWCAVVKAVMDLRVP